jgi:NAD dependent epimerase/dehydratase
MTLKGKRVLVTGAGGFIGSHLAERLVQEGADVTAMVHYNALGSRGWLQHSSLVADMKLVHGDIIDRDSVAGAMRDIDTVFHLAALIAIPYSYAAPASYVNANIVGTLNVLQCAREMGTRRVIHTSTSEVYGTALQVPIDESHPLQGQSPYSASKIGADKMAEAFCKSFDLPVVTIRPFNTFGPRQSARAIIPTLISQCLAGNPELRLGNVSPTRDFNYVANTVEGYILAATAHGIVGEAINLGTGREISIGDLAALVSGLTGTDIPVVSDAQRVRPENSEVERLLADNTKALNLLGWSPTVSLEDGLRNTIEWLKGHQEWYRPNDYTV